MTLSALYPAVGRPASSGAGLTPSGTVRLIDRLEAAGYVTRRPGADARSVALRLTASGRRAAERVSAARADVLQDALSELAPEERKVLDQLISRVLTGMIRPPGAVRWTCRLCDTTACGRETGDCPVANRARELYA